MESNSNSTIAPKKSLLDKIEGDKIVWVIAIMLALLSILVVYSASSSLAYRLAGGNTEKYLFAHILFVLAGLAMMFVAHKVNFVYYSRLSRLALIISAILLVLAWRYGISVSMASRWLEIPFLNRTFQPSDLAKIALIINLASMIVKRQNDLEEFNQAIIPMLIWCGVICGLIALTNWSTATILFATCLLLFYVGRVPTRYIFWLLVVGALAGAVALQYGQRKGTVLSRIDDFLDEENINPQIAQSFIAISTGGFSGKGVGRSTQRNFLPLAHSDFIYAIIVEEYGMLGALFVIGLYLALLYRGMIIVSKTNHAFGALLAAGVVFMIVVQAFTHMAVVVGIFPVTGLPLPMVSMGGTSMIFTGLAFGVLLSVSRHIQAQEDDLESYRFRRSGGSSNYVLKNRTD
jgi:cell division protein FtsW